MAKRARNGQSKREVGQAKRFQKRTSKRFQKQTPAAPPAPAAEPFVCDYCYHTDWRTDSRQRYCQPSRERKLAHLRRAALVDLLYTLMPWRCGVTLDVVRRMVKAAEHVLLVAVRRLGFVWDEASKQFAWVQAEGAKAA